MHLPCDLHLAEEGWPAGKRANSKLGGWAGLPPPSPAFSILRNNRVFHFPKTPSPERGGGGELLPPHKAETPVLWVFRWRRQTHLCGSLLSEPAEDSFGPILPSPYDSFAQHFSPSGLPLTQGWMCHAKTNLVHLKGLKGSCISGDIFPAFLTHPASFMWAGRTPRKKSKPSSVFPEPLSSKACPPCEARLFCSCETCAELHSSWKHILSTNLPGVELRLGGETAGKKASSKLVDECSKKQLPCIAKIMSHLLRWMVFPFLFWCFIYNRVFLTYGKVHTDHRRGPIA